MSLTSRQGWKTRQYCVFKCTGVGAYMHRFPHPEKKLDLFKSWVNIVGDKLKETDPWKIYKNKRVCALHFTSEQTVASHRLILGAVPSVNLNGAVLTPGILVHLEHNYCYQSIGKNNASSSQVGTDTPIIEDEGSPSLPKFDKCESNLMNQTDIEGQSKADEINTFDNSHATEESNQAVLTSPVNIVYSGQQQGFATVVPSSKDPDDADEDRTVDIAAADNATPPSPVGAGEPSTAVERTDDNDAVYTWQSDALVVPCDELTGTIDMDVTELESEPEPEPSAAPTPADEDDNTVHEGLKCNHCHGDIVGFRYTCVQCADYDLCGACEARREHRRHYALRVPAPRPYEEIQTVLLAIRRALSSSILEVRCDGLPVEVKEESDPFGDVNEPTELLEYENECVEDCHTDLEEHTDIETEQTDTEESHTVIEETHEDIEETHKAIDAVDSDRLQEQILMDEEEENMNIEYTDLEDDLNMKSVVTFQLERRSPLKSRVTIVPKIVLSSVKSKQSHPVKLLLMTEKVDNIPKETVAWAQSKVMRGRSARRGGATVVRTNTARTESTRDSQDGNTPGEARVLVRRLNEEQLSLYENRRTKRGRPYRGWPP